MKHYSQNAGAAILEPSQGLDGAEPQGSNIPEGKLRQIRQKIDEERQLLHRHQADLAEVMAIVMQKEMHITMLEALFKQTLESAKTFDGSAGMSLDVDAGAVCQKTPRQPMDMIGPEFKGMQLGEMIEFVLEQAQHPLTTTEIGQLIYNTTDKDEFARARNSLSAELRSGAAKQPPRWIKKGRSAYVALSLELAGSQGVPSQCVKGGEVDAV